jgi:AcrR family transcriptional regulator
MVTVEQEVPIGPEEWIGAALHALAEEGEVGLAVEPLARRLGVTKGSFYWHFKDRDALWAALLQDFEQVATEGPIQALSAQTDPRQRLAGLFTLALAAVWHLRVERALLCSRRPDVIACFSRVHARRRAYLVQCYEELGFEPERAQHFAATVYAAFLGAVQLSDQPPFDTEPTLRAWVQHYTELMVPAPDPRAMV